MTRIGQLCLHCALVTALGAALGACATVDAPVSRDAMAQLLDADAAYYEMHFDAAAPAGTPRTPGASWLTGGAAVLAVAPGEVRDVELVAGSVRFVGEAESVGGAYQIGLVGTDPQGAPAMLRLTAVMNESGLMSGSGVLDSDGRAIAVTFSAKPTEAPATGDQPCVDGTAGTRYHLPDGVRARARDLCDGRRTSR